MSGHLLASSALVFAVSSAPLALVCPRQWLLEHVEWALEPIGERNHSWLQYKDKWKKKGKAPGACCCIVWFSAIFLFFLLWKKHCFIMTAVCISAVWVFLSLQGISTIVLPKESQAKRSIGPWLLKTSVSFTSVLVFTPWVEIHPADATKHTVLFCCD